MKYAGTELEVFAYAQNWKRYWAGQVRRFLRGEVLEVGAGTGVNTSLLWNQHVRSLTCLEPDPDLAAGIGQEAPRAGWKPAPRGGGPAGPGAPAGPGGVRPAVVVGTTADLPGVEAFDAILYVDVLEHIEDDRRELARAYRLLRPGGHLIVVSPAYPSLFTEFDRAVGHYRRYTRRSLAAAAPGGLVVVSLGYLDSVGVLLSLGNRLLLRRAEPSLAQIVFWDRYVVPASRGLDWLTGHRLGKSVLGVWNKPGVTVREPAWVEPAPA